MYGDVYVVVTASCCSQATAEYDQGNFQGFDSRNYALFTVVFIKARLQAGCLGACWLDSGLDFDHKLHGVPLVAVPENGSISESKVQQQA